MTRERIETGLVLAIVLAVGVAAWRHDAREPLVAEPTSLASVPRIVDGFVGQDLEIAGEVEEMLRADFHVQREYRKPGEGLVWLYVGYYGSARGGTPEHTPRVCYAAHGWQVHAEQVVATDDAAPLRLQEYLLEHGAERRLVHFYYRSHRSTGILGLARLRVDHVIGNLVDGRADGALIRLSAPIGPDDEEKVRARLLAFAAALEPTLGAAWPVEGPAAVAAPL